MRDVERLRAEVLGELEILVEAESARGAIAPRCSRCRGVERHRRGFPSSARRPRAPRPRNNEPPGKRSRRDACPPSSARGRRAVRVPSTCRPETSRPCPSRACRLVHREDEPRVRVRRFRRERELEFFPIAADARDPAAREHLAGLRLERDVQRGRRALRPRVETHAIRPARIDDESILRPGLRRFEALHPGVGAVRRLGRGEETLEPLIENADAAAADFRPGFSGSWDCSH